MGRIHVSSKHLSFLTSQKQTRNILKIKSYYRITVDEMSATAGAHIDRSTTASLFFNRHLCSKWVFVSLNEAQYYMCYLKKKTFLISFAVTYVALEHW